MSALKTYLFLLLFVCSSFLMAQNASVEIDESSWKEVTEKIDYTETFKEFDDEDTDIDKSNLEEISSLDYDWSSLKYVFYACVVCLVLFLLYKILSNIKTNPNIKPQDLSVESIKEIEDKMLEIDLNKLLEEALVQENYQVAIRINFLIIIKLLSEKKHIDWAKEKTNWEYYSEIKDILKKDGFKQIIISFEPVWYGEHSLTKEGYLILSPLFNKYQQLLESNE